MTPKLKVPPEAGGPVTPPGAGARRGKTTRATLQAMKKHGEKIAMVTAYDFPFARLADQAGADVLLVGDSLGMVVLGFDSTLPVTLAHMLHHTQAVTRARPQAMVVADMPFMTYQVSAEDALRNAGRLVQEAGAEAVKLEGGAAIAPMAEAIARAGIPVMGHLGLTPQSVHQLGGYRVQGRTADTAARLHADARALQDAGCFAIVLEAVPMAVAGEITAGLEVPTIGIGAGKLCDGQVLVLHDLLGLFAEFVPRFVKQYADLGTAARTALQAFVADVRSGRFPGEEHTYA
jgi:3-methyl-2-oxobutanoate hydroxymethyltransferase